MHVMCENDLWIGPMCFRLRLVDDNYAILKPFLLPVDDNN